MDWSKAFRRRGLTWFFVSSVAISLVLSSLAVRTALANFGNPTPAIENLTVEHIGYGVWEITGNVVWDDGQIGEAEITFGGLIDGATCQTVGDGSFLYAEMMDPQITDSISAKADDSMGESSPYVYYIW